MRSRSKKVVTFTAMSWVIAVCAASAGATTVHRSSENEGCTWGASSITATYDNGHLTESEPQTSGCTSYP